MMFMGIPPLALTGAVFGAFLSGVFYRASHGKIICAVIGEIFGTGIIGSLVSYPVMASMANGDFTVNTEIEDKYVGKFVELLQSVRNMNRKMNATLKIIIWTNMIRCARKISGRQSRFATMKTSCAIPSRVN